MCDEAAVVRYVWGEMTGEERSAFEQHLSTCEACRELVKKHRLLKDTLQDMAPHVREGCPPENVLVDYMEGTLEAEQAEEVEEHALICDICLPAVREVRRWRLLHLWGLRALAQLLGSGLLEVSLLPEGRRIFAYREPVTEVAAPRTAGRLAAEEAPGFRREVKVEKGAPFRATLERMGDLFRLTLKALHDDFRWCLVKFRLNRADACVYEGVISVTEGEGSVTFKPSSEMHGCVLGVEVVTSEEALEALGRQVMVQVLGRLLKHADVEVRRAAVRLLAIAGTPEAIALLREARSDSDEEVRRIASETVRWYE